MRIRKSIHLCLVLAVLAVEAIGPANAQKAATFWVGSCKPGKADFNTIQQAVSTVPAGSTVNVCPGTYAEQVTIQEPLTLQGVNSGNNGNAVITAPAAGLADPAAQLSVIDAGGPVNISNLVMDSTGITVQDTQSSPTAIYCDSSPCTLNRLVVQTSEPAGASVGIFVTDGAGIGPAITIKNSVIQLSANPSSYAGIEVVGSTVDTTVDFENNAISSGSGIVYFRAGGTISGNTIQASGQGIEADQGTTPVEVNGNLLVGNARGFDVVKRSGSVTFANNDLVNDEVGILSEENSGSITIKGNQISATVTDIDLGCAAPAVLSGNTFLSTPIGLAHVPSGVSFQKSAGTFVGVPQIETVCN